MIGRLRAQVSGGSLKSRTIRSAFLTLVHFGGSQFLRLVANLILTRILFPEAFGLVALVVVVTQGLSMMTATGIRTSIIQNPRGDEPIFQNTAWTMEIIRMLLLWSFIWLVSDHVASFYEQPQLAWLLPVASVTIVINAFQSTRVAGSERHLNIGKLTYVELVSQLVGSVVMVVLALITGSVWALVVGMIVNSIVRTTLTHTVLSGIKNRFQWDWTCFWDLFHFGKYIWLGSIAAFVIDSGDRAVLGKYVTLTELAVYQIAFFIATVPAMISKQMNGKVMFAMYARSAEYDSPETRRKQQMARAALSGGFLTAALFFGLIGQWLIGVLYGPEYQLAGPIMVLLALAYLPDIILSIYAQKFDAAGKPSYMSVFTTLRASVQMTLLLLLVPQIGLMGAMVAVPAAAMIAYVVAAVLARKHGIHEAWLDFVLFAYAVVGAALVLWANEGVLDAVRAGA